MLRTVFFLTPVLLLAQADRVTYQTDINGNKIAVAGDQSATAGKTSVARSVNGRAVPLEETTEKVLRSDGKTKLTEKVVQRYDGNGRPTVQERVLLEETTLPDGTKRVTESTAKSDLNGQFHDTSRKITETRTSGSRTEVSTTVDRATVNGGYSTEERSNAVTTGSKNDQQTAETVQRMDTNGRFQTVGRNDTTTQTSGSNTSSTTASYALDANGNMTLLRQKVAKTTTQADGSSVAETTTYVPAASGGKLDVAEQQVVDSKVGPGGQVVQSVSVRVASPAAPGTLGPANKVSETVCTGKCLPAPPTVAAAAPAASADAKSASSKGK